MKTELHVSKLSKVKSKYEVYANFPNFRIADLSLIEEQIKTAKISFSSTIPKLQHA